jgi:hypothetical protein
MQENDGNLRLLVCNTFLHVMDRGVQANQMRRSWSDSFLCSSNHTESQDVLSQMRTTTDIEGRDGCPRELDGGRYNHVKLGSITNSESMALCSICLDGCFEGQPAQIVLSCGHHFHAKCVERWLERQANCPNCRCNVSPSMIYRARLLQMMLPAKA